LAIAWAWLNEYSYAFVLAAAAIDALAIPFPGRVVLLAGGVFAASSRIELWGVLAAGISGAVAGDHVWYFAGRLAPGRLQALSRYLATRHGGTGLEAVDYLRRHGGVVILIGRFVATVRVLVWPVASAHGIGYGRFLAWDLGAATLWAALFVLGGYVLGRPALALMDRWGGWALVIVIIALSVLTGGVLMWRRSPRGPKRTGRQKAGRGRRSR
jgi:membrane protein DedA with SNARE-associated domain